MSLSVIIPNYNGAEILKKSLPHLLSVLEDYKHLDVEIIISDDSSSDNSIEIINEIIKNDEKGVKIKLVETGENKGFSGNVNNAVRFATKDLLVLLNTDVLPEKNFLKPVLEIFKKEKVFAVGCLDKSYEGEKVIDRGRGIGVWRKALLVHGKGSDDKNSTLWVSGGSGIFRRSIWNKLGGLYEIYDPFYWEDIDLSYRAKKSGYNIYFEKGSIVKHLHEEGVIKKKYTSSRVKSVSYRNQFIFTWINSDFGTFISSFFWIPYQVIKAFIGGDKEILFGFIKALIKFPQALSLRIRVNKMFVLKDSEVILED